MFLAHHAVIYMLTPIMKPYITNKFGVLLLFAIELAVTFVSALAVKALTGLIIKGVRKIIGRRFVSNLTKFTLILIIKVRFSPLLTSNR